MLAGPLAQRYSNVLWQLAPTLLIQKPYNFIKSDAALQRRLNTPLGQLVDLGRLAAAIFGCSGCRALGHPPELEARKVSVRQLEIVARDTHTLTIELRVSKGYYVRSLARDLGAALGVPTHLNQLRRLASGSFSLAEARAWPPATAPEPLPLARALANLLPTLRLSDTGVTRARAGQLLSDADFLEEPSVAAHTHAGSEPTLCAWIDRNGAPIALGARGADGCSPDAAESVLVAVAGVSMRRGCR